MNKWLPVFLVLTILISCKENNKTGPFLDSHISAPNKIIGTWKLVYAEIQENDSVIIKDVTKSDFIKIISQSHFAFFNQNHSDSDQFYGGAGTYTLKDSNYVEVLDFIKNESLRGHTFPFKVEFKGDTLIQFGLEEVKEANIKRYIIEKYIKIVDLN